MSDRRKLREKGRSDSAGRHVRLYHWLTDSPAWGDLCGGARATYLILLRRYGGSGTNNGRIPLSVRELADELGVGKTTAAEYLATLQSHGFIVVCVRGAFSHRNKQATEWRLTEFGCDVTKDLPSKLFMRWAPGRDLTVRPGVRGVPEGGPIGTSARTVPERKAAFGT